MTVPLIEKYRKNLTSIKFPEDFNHEWSKDYVSDYEYTKSLSTYHFDKTVKEDEGEYFDIVGQFVGDWDAELQTAIDASFPARCRDRRWPRGGEVPTIVQEKYDEETWGYDPRHAQSNAVKNKFMKEHCPNLWKMVEYFGLEKYDPKFMCQMPGQSFRLHIDKMQHRCPSDPWQVVRLEIALADWQPGQFWQHGNTFYKWRKGEVSIFDWPNIPHATGNASFHPRPFIQLTGLRTERTDEILSKASRDQKFVL